MPPSEQGYDASDQQQVDKAKAAAGLRELASRDVLKALLSSPAGRNWMWDLLQVGHLYETSFDRDPLAMAFREGERNFALRLLLQVTTATPELYAQMMAEKGQA